MYNPLGVGAAGEPAGHRLDLGLFGELPSLRATGSVCKVLIPPWQVVRTPAEQPPAGQVPRWAPAPEQPPAGQVPHWAGPPLGSPPPGSPPLGTCPVISSAAVRATSPGLCVHSHSAQTSAAQTSILPTVQRRKQVKRGQVSWPRRPSTPKEQRLDLNPSWPPANPSTAPQTVPLLSFVLSLSLLLLWLLFLLFRSSPHSHPHHGRCMKKGGENRTALGSLCFHSQSRLHGTQGGQSRGIPRNRAASRVGRTPRPALGCIVHCVHVVFSRRRLSVTHTLTCSLRASGGVLCSFLAAGAPWFAGAAWLEVGRVCLSSCK